MLQRLVVSCVLLLLIHGSAWGDSFGSGANAFEVEFVTVGHPGNVADTTGKPNPTGSVPYAYRIGKYEISEAIINKANFLSLGKLGITLSNRGADKPATSVTWNEVARFVNWLNTSSGSVPAYKFAAQPGQGGYSANASIQLWAPGDPGYDPSNPYRNSLARYFLPSTAEWYKAAYYDPAGQVYYKFPTGSDTIPTPVASGTSSGTAVYAQTSPADVSLAGGLSPYGTMGQGGNVFEWEETDSDLINDSGASSRGARGGEWDFSYTAMRSTSRSDALPNLASNSIGFRVASLPPPAVPGDYNHDGAVDAADYVVWRDGLGSIYTMTDYDTWKSHFGESLASAAAALDVAGSVSGLPAVPEPSCSVLLGLAAAVVCMRRRRKA